MSVTPAVREAITKALSDMVCLKGGLYARAADLQTCDSFDDYHGLEKFDLQRDPVTGERCYVPEDQAFCGGEDE